MKENDLWFPHQQIFTFIINFINAVSSFKADMIFEGN